MSPGLVLDEDCPELPDPRKQKYYRSFTAKLQFAASWILAPRPGPESHATAMGRCPLGQVINVTESPTSGTRAVPDSLTAGTGTAVPQPHTAGRARPSTAKDSMSRFQVHGSIPPATVSSKLGRSPVISC